MDYALRELNCARALVIQPGASVLKPIQGHGIPLDRAFQDLATQLVDEAFSTRQLRLDDSAFCLPIPNSRGQIALLLYGDRPTAPFPPDTPGRLLRLARELGKTVDQPVAGEGIRPETLVAGRYRVEEQLLQCRFSTLYRAFDRASGVHLVLRHLEDPGQSREARLQTLREGRTLHRLRHRNLPRVLDVVEDQGHIYVVLEDVYALTLEATVARDGPLHPELIWRYLKQLLSVLAYLHGQEKPIVHRDLRPDTILVSRHGVLKIGEFGLAKMAEAQAGAQTAFRAHGHPNYAAPEQLLGDASHPRNDLYAVGAVLYFLATGMAPPESLSRYMAGEALPTIARTDFPSDLEETIARLMNPDAGARPQATSEVLPPEPEADEGEGSIPITVAPLPEMPARKLSMWQLLFGGKKAREEAAHVPAIDLTRMDLDRKVGRLLPEGIARSIVGVCVARLGPSEITVAVRDPGDPGIEDSIRLGTRGLYNPTIVGADPALLARAQEFVYSSEPKASTWQGFLKIKSA